MSKSMPKPKWAQRNIKCFTVFDGNVISVTESTQLYYNIRCIAPPFLIERLINKLNERKRHRIGG